MNSPVVNVPVLSNEIALTSGIVSSTWADLIIIPLRLSCVVAQVSAVGVANANAQGQVTTRTDKVIQNASLGS